MCKWNNLNSAQLRTAENIREVKCASLLFSDVDLLGYHYWVSLLGCRNLGTLALGHAPIGISYDIIFICRNRLFATSRDRIHRDGLNTLKYEKIDSKQLLLYTWILVKVNQSAILEPLGFS